MITRKASAVWNGGLKDGKGTLSTESEVLKQTPYSFSTRFEGHKGTNPEELIGAAHAGCFTMALSLNLGEAGFTPERLETHAAVGMEKTDLGMAVTKIHLEVTGDVPGIDPARFEEIATRTKDTCIISRLLKTDITLDAKLRSGSRT